MKTAVPILFACSLAACALDQPAPLPDIAAPADSGSGDSQAAALSPITEPDQGLRLMIEMYRAGNTEAALIIGRSLADQYPGTPWYRRSLFVTEQVQIAADRADEADAAMLRVKAEYPEMGDYAFSLLADYHFSGRRFTRAAAFYQDLMDGYPQSILANRAAFRRGLSLLEAEAFAPAVDAFEAFLQAHPRSEFAPDAGLALGRALIALGKSDAAVRQVRRVSIRFPGTTSEQEALKMLSHLSASGVQVGDLTGSEWHEKGTNLFRTARYDKAIEAFRKQLEKEPNSVNRAEALFRIGLSQFHTGRRSEAVSTLEAFVTKHPHDQRAAEAAFWTGRSYSRLGEREKAIRTLTRVVNKYPRSEWADDALFWIGNVYRDANDNRKAFTYYSRLAAEYPESRFSDSAIWWNAWASYTSGEYGKANEILEQLVKRYPRSFLVYQARYWQGRIAERMGDTAVAAAHYGRVLKRGPFTYYGYRAAERLAAIGPGGTAPRPDSTVDIISADCEDEECSEGSFVFAETDEGPPVWTVETQQLLEAEPSFKKTLELMHVDMKKEAAAELWHLQEKIPRRREALLGLSKAFFDLGDYYRSLLLVLRNYDRYLDGESRELPSDLWRLAYPQGYWDSIQSFARQYGQDPYLIASIIRQESQFHPEALSPAGARGVMQVMPATGEWIARNIKMSGYNRARLFESDTSINLGTWYISHLMKRFGHDPLLAAAAYNAGPDAVSGWVLKAGQSGDRDEFVESIPYSETRGYVKKVLRNYAEYRRIYGKTGAGEFPVRNPVGVNSLVMEDTARNR